MFKEHGQPIEISWEGYAGPSRVCQVGTGVLYEHKGNKVVEFDSKLYACLGESWDFHPKGTHHATVQPLIAPEGFKYYAD